MFTKRTERAIEVASEFNRTGNLPKAIPFPGDLLLSIDELANAVGALSTLLAQERRKVRALRIAVNRGGS